MRLSSVPLTVTCQKLKNNHLNSKLLGLLCACFFSKEVRIGSCRRAPWPGPTAAELWAAQLSQAAYLQQAAQVYAAQAHVKLVHVSGSVLHSTRIFLLEAMPSPCCKFVWKLSAVSLAMDEKPTLEKPQTQS